MKTHLITTRPTLKCATSSSTPLRSLHARVPPDPPPLPRLFLPVVSNFFTLRVAQLCAAATVRASPAKHLSGSPFIARSALLGHPVEHVVTQLHQRLHLHRVRPPAKDVETSLVRASHRTVTGLAAAASTRVTRPTQFSFSHPPLETSTHVPTKQSSMRIPVCPTSSVPVPVSYEPSRVSPSAPVSVDSSVSKSPSRSVSTDCLHGFKESASKRVHPARCACVWSAASTLTPVHRPPHASGT